MRFYFLAFLLRLLKEPLHHIRVLAGMNGQHPMLQIRHSFFSHCLVLILGIHILKYLFRVEWYPVCIVSFDPQAGSVIIFIIGYVNGIISEILLRSFICCFALNLEEPVLHNLLYLLGSYLINSGSWWCICG